MGIIYIYIIINLYDIYKLKEKKNKLKIIVNTNSIHVN